jgi:lipid II:glycine glycyltransferase (peptidoglycan interpeptide bridge formation enzyme)
VESYYDLLKETRKRKSISGLLPLSYYIDVFRKLGRDRAKLLLALYRDDPVAGAFLLNDNKRFYYWSGASTQTGLSLGANSVIQWKAILLGKEMGLREYDLVGGNIPSVAFFKAGFGGSIRSYYRFIVARPPLLGGLVRRSLQLFDL